MTSVATLDSTVHVGTETDIQQSVLRHTEVGQHCRIINSVIEGHADAPVVIGDHVTLINCHVYYYCTFFYRTDYLNKQSVIIAIP